MPWATVLRTVFSGLEKKPGLCLYLIVGARGWGRAPEARDGSEARQRQDSTSSVHLVLLG